MSEHSQQVRLLVEDQKEKFSIFNDYLNIVLTRRSGLYSRIKETTHCYSFMEPNRGSDVSTADLKHTCGNTIFLFGVNPCKALQFM